MSTPDPLSEFRTHALSLVRTYFAEHRQGFLLSQLGTSLRRQLGDLDAVLGGRRLAEVIRTEMATELSIVPSPLDEKVLRVLPRGEVASAEGQVSRVEVTERPKLPRVSPIVWLAFVRPPAEGLVRKLSLDGLDFEDVASDQVRPGDLVVPETSILPRQASESVQEHASRVFASIQTWLRSNNVPFDRVSTKAGERKPSRSLLDQVLGALSQDQLKRVSLPLDVVESLLKG